MDGYSLYLRAKLFLSIQVVSANKCPMPAYKAMFTRVEEVISAIAVMPGPTNCHVGAGVTIDRDLVSVAIYDREQSRLSGISRGWMLLARAGVESLNVQAGSRVQ